MSQANRDQFPPMDRTTEYMVPGPGMSAVQPWLLPAPEPVDSGPSNEPRSKPDTNGEPARATEPEAQAEPPAPKPEPPARSPQPNGVRDLPPFLHEELAPILASAQRAADQIVERARAKAQEEFAEVERERQRVEHRMAEVHAERRRIDERMAELANWQEQIQPMVRWLQGKMEEIRSRVDELPELIRQGLDPLASAVATMDPNLAEMSSVAERLMSIPPLRRSEPEATQ